jgi:hypothetical protein
LRADALIFVSNETKIAWNLGRLAAAWRAVSFIQTIYYMDNTYIKSVLPRHLAHYVRTEVPIMRKPSDGKQSTSCGLALSLFAEPVLVFKKVSQVHHYYNEVRSLEAVLVHKLPVKGRLLYFAPSPLPVLPITAQLLLSSNFS